MNFQQLLIIGRVGRDSEMRYTPNGQAVTSFSVAVSEEYTKDGSKVKSTVWIRVSVWGKLAEVCNQYVRKGMLVQCVGKLKGDDSGSPRIFNKQDGTPSTSFEMTAQSVLFLSKNDAPVAKSEQVEEDMPF